MYLPELMASGIPIVQPALGAFPEIVKLSGGGMVYEPNTPEILAKSWTELLADSDKLEKMSFQARKGVNEFFNIYDHSREMIDIYNKLIDNAARA
jgi:glycosyltransferase involved in cell wall biosynthesis